MTRRAVSVCKLVTMGEWRRVPQGIHSGRLSGDSLPEQGEMTRRNVSVRSVNTRLDLVSSVQRLITYLRHHEKVRVLSRGGNV
jgi:hypothetical protein